MSTFLAAAPLVVMVTPFLPGIIMSDGMKSLAIIAGMEALLLGVALPVVDGLLTKPSRRIASTAVEVISLSSQA